MASEELINKFKNLITSVSPDEFIEFRKNHQGIGFILMYLYRNQDKEVLSGELASKLNVSTSRISTLLKKIESKGMIVRKSSPIDCRLTIVEITQKGKEEIIKKQKEGEKMLSQIIDYVGEEDLMEFFRISKKMKEALKKEKEEQDV